MSQIAVFDAGGKHGVQRRVQADLHLRRVVGLLTTVHGDWEAGILHAAQQPSPLISKDPRKSMRTYAPNWFVPCFFFYVRRQSLLCGRPVSPVVVLTEEPYTVRG